MTPKSPPKKKSWSWRSQAFRGLIYQCVAIGLIAAAVWFIAHNTLYTMKIRGIQSGFDFLTGPAGFDIGESLYPFDSAQPYWQAFLVGLTNTLRVAILGIVLTTTLGTLLGVGRFSRNALVRGVCYAYVEFFRNVPVLLQLLMWYLFFTEVPVWATGHLWALVGLVAGVALAFVYRRWAHQQFEVTGHLKSMFWTPVAICLTASLLGWLVGGAPMALDVPIKGEFAIEKGGSLTPEFLSVLLGLSIYTAAFVAEVVRSGIQSVALGQKEAAAALGLNPGQSMRLVMLPQALRVIIPPMTNQFLNLTKNSSLAVAIGYPDVVSIANTALNQTGRAVECISIVMLVYLCTSLTTSLLMNWYNTRSAIQER